MPLQGSGQDFGAARRPAIDKDRNRFASRHIPRLCAINFVAAPAPRSYDLAAIEKNIRDGHDLIQQPAVIVS